MSQPFGPFERAMVRYGDREEDYVSGWLDRRSGVLYCSPDCAKKAGVRSAKAISGSSYSTEAYGALCPECDLPYPGY